MIITELFNEFGDPTLAWENAMDKVANENSYYLYEIHHMSMNFWENKVWIFNTLDEFGGFTLALDLFNYLYYSEDLSNIQDNSDVKELHNKLANKKGIVWNLDNCMDYIKNFDNLNIELKAFGRIESLIHTSEKDFEKSKKHYSTLDELNIEELEEASYQILHRYSKVSEKAPCKSISEFLEFISSWE